MANCKQKDDKISELICNVLWRHRYSVKKKKNIDINREADVQKKNRETVDITVQNVHVQSNKRLLAAGKCCRHT